jgi:Ino eighty subunit 2
LRRQSGRRNKRNALATAEDREAGSAAGSDEDGEEVPEAVPEAPIPTMYRWISSTRPVDDGQGSVTPAMVMSFSVPQSVNVAARESQIREAAAYAEELRKAKEQPSQCAIDGCSHPRKYRLVKNWDTGACGLAHLKALEAAC